jgi:enoyl-CoA hydratase
LNSWTSDDWQEVRKTITEAENDDNVKTIVFKGAGPAFGTGHYIPDIEKGHGWTSQPKGRRPSQRQRLFHDRNLALGAQSLMYGVLYCYKATIAQIHGYCYGGHIEFAANCDISIASEDALFTHAGYRYIGPMGNIAYLILTMGAKKVKEMMLTGIPLTASEAFQCGLINRVVPRDKLDDEVDKIADAISAMPIDAIVMGKANFDLAMNILGVSAGQSAAYITHTLQTNIRYEPDEFNLFKSRRDKGVKGAIADREAKFSSSLLARHQREDTKEKSGE